MKKISIKPRTGKDFLEFNKRVLINQKLAQDWAIEEFILIDGEPITPQQIAKLKPENYIKFTASIFNLDTPASNEPDHIEIMGVCIKKKRISRDFITELQSFAKNSNNDNIKMMKYCISEFYDVEISFLEQQPYQIMAYLLNQINFFLSSIAEQSDEFYIDELFD